MKIAVKAANLVSSSHELIERSRGLVETSRELIRESRTMIERCMGPQGETKR